MYVFGNLFNKMQADEMEILISELAKVTGGEKALIEECGDLLSKTHAFQVCTVLHEK